MFTGIVEEVGRISSIKKLKSGEYVLSIKCKKISPSNLSIGDSVAVNGACLTVTKKDKKPNTEACVVWDTDLGQWRSFRWDRLQTVKETS